MFREWFKRMKEFSVTDLFLVSDFDLVEEEKDVEERETEDEELDGILPGGILMGTCFCLLV